MALHDTLRSKQCLGFLANEVLMCLFGNKGKKEFLVEEEMEVELGSGAGDREAIFFFFCLVLVNLGEDED